jgi:hypothetical protein
MATATIPAQSTRIWGLHIDSASRIGKRPPSGGFLLLIVRGNGCFREDGGTPERYRGALARAATLATNTHIF